VYQGKASEKHEEGQLLEEKKVNQSDIRKVIFIITIPFLGLVIGNVFREKSVIGIVLTSLAGIISSIIMIKKK